MDKIDYYQNVRTKLTVAPKCKNQNSSFVYIICHYTWYILIKKLYFVELFNYLNFNDFFFGWYNVVDVYYILQINDKKKSHLLLNSTENV